MNRSLRNILFAVLFLMPAPLAVAREDTSRLLLRLVVTLDEKLTSLESLAARRKQFVAAQQGLVADLLARYHQASTGVDRATVELAIARSLRRLNLVEQTNVRVLLDQLVAFSECMQSFKVAIGRSFDLQREQQGAHAGEMRRFVSNAARLVRALEAADRATAGDSRIEMLKQRLVLLHAQWVDSKTSISNAIQKINEAISPFDQFAVELHNTLKRLQNDLSALEGARGDQLPALLRRCLSGLAWAESLPPALAQVRSSRLFEDFSAARPDGLSTREILSLN